MGGLNIHLICSKWEILRPVVKRQGKGHELENAVSAGLRR